jgi:hypothetical protein
MSAAFAYTPIQRGNRDSDRSTRGAGGIRKPPGKGRRQLTPLFKSEIRNTKYETNSNHQNSNDQTKKLNARSDSSQAWIDRVLQRWQKNSCH